MSCHAVVLLFAISANSLFIHVTALNAEDIIGGYIAYERTFKYQASIQTVNHTTFTYYPICGGAIIHDYFVISAANCLIDASASLIKKSFRVIVGTTDLDNLNKIIVHIDYIYVANFEEKFSVNHFVLIRLKESLDVENNARLAKLKLPPSYQPFNGLIGTVSGHGYDWVKNEIDPNTGVITSINGGAISLLKTASVPILSDKECLAMYPDISVDSFACGLMSIESKTHHWGLCWGDAGNPLVINDMIVGVAIKSTMNCDNTKIGALYVKISPFTEFIEDILQRNTPIVLD